MKLIKYIFCPRGGNDTQEVLTSKQLSYSEENLAIAKKEAYNGQYTIEDDGNETSPKPTIGARLKLVEQFIEMIKSVFPNITG